MRSTRWAAAIVLFCVALRTEPAFAAVEILAVLVGIKAVGLWQSARRSLRAQVLRPQRPVVRDQRPPRPADDEPRDAIPPGYPGYRGSIRFIPMSELRSRSRD